MKPAPEDSINSPNSPDAQVQDIRDEGDVWARIHASPDTPLPVGAAARYLDVSVSHLYRLLARREVAHYKPAGKRVYLLKRDLDDYCLRNRVATDEEVEREAATRVAFTSKNAA